jgi:mannose-6-phosphate isomerase-like protein (cupin superfamily)
VNRIRFEGFSWEGVEPRPYKEGEGDFKGVVRHTLARRGQIPAAFELRYFELEPGGYSSLEKHEHVHFVIALRGTGKALVGDEIVELEPFDAVYVPPRTPHRFLNDREQPFGFLCPVDAERDRPQRLEEAELEALRADPTTAPYV